MQTVARFTGSIPRLYDRMLGPFLFEWTAERMAARVQAPAGGRVLEVACGTGICTAALRRALPSDVEIVATDLNEGMLREARQWRGGLPGVRFEAADAQVLPYPDASFDVLVCQFGLMFFPDALGALREARRVLRPGGQLLFSTWGALADNPAVELVQDVIGSFFPQDRPRFLETPFGMHESARLEHLFARAGATNVRVEACDHVVVLPSAHGPAQGLIRGTPGALELDERGIAADVVAETAESALAARFGGDPFRAPLRAIFIRARA